MTEQNYPGVIDRVKAIVTDGVVILALIFLISYVFSLFENVPNSARIIGFIFIVFLYDPLLTSFFGGTIGHMMLGLRVKTEFDEQKNIPLEKAFLRYIVKALLGSISLLTVSSNMKRKAIHDTLVGSVVIYVK